MITSTIRMARQSRRRRLTIRHRSCGRIEMLREIADVGNEEFGHGQGLKTGSVPCGKHISEFPSVQRAKPRSCRQRMK